MINALIKSEIFKSSRFKMLWLAVFLPILIPSFTIFMMLDADAATFRKNMAREHETNAFFFLSMVTFVVLAFFIPIIITMVVISLNYMERQANGWKYLIMSPFNNIQILLSKFFLSSIYILACLLFFYLSHMCFGQLLSVLRPDLAVYISSADLLFFWILYLKIFLCSLGIVPVIWAIGLISRSYIVISFFTAIFGVFIPRTFLPFKLPGDRLLNVIKLRREYHQAGNSFGVTDLLEINYMDALSFLWLISGFILMAIFFKHLTRKLI
jgi:hypothetical protein